MSEIITVSRNEIIRLYPDIKSLDRAWKGTFVITLVQYMCEVYAENNGGCGVAKKVLSDSYKYIGLDDFVSRLIGLRNDVCHRCGLKSTNENMNSILYDSRLKRLLVELCILDNCNSKKEVNPFSAALKMSGD